MLIAPADPATGNTPLIPANNPSLPHNYTINPRNMQVHAEIGGVADTAAWGCSTDANCCQVGVTKYTDGSNVCDIPYTCRPSGICLTATETSPIPSLDFIMVQNGAQPIAK
jgi:hypothetical protein